MSTLPILHVASMQANKSGVLLSLMIVSLCCFGVCATQTRELSPDMAQILDSTKCNIDHIDELTADEFFSLYKRQRPVILSRSRFKQQHSELIERTSRNEILRTHGNEMVRLASSNSFSHDKLDITLDAYMQSYMVDNTLTNLANETWYFFGDLPQQSRQAWTSLTHDYVLPMDSAQEEGIVAFGLAAKWTGVRCVRLFSVLSAWKSEGNGSFHTHDAAWSEPLHGRKRWYVFELRIGPFIDEPCRYLFPPGAKPSFNADESQLQWLTYVYPLLDERDKPLECTVHVGETIYIPRDWYHATLNLDTYNVFVSVFTREAVYSEL